MLVGAGAGAIALWLRLSGRVRFTDYDQIWIASRALVRHSDAYATVAANFHWPLFYPLPAAIVGAPFAVLPMTSAGPAFVGIGFGLFAYGLTARAWWPLIVLCSAPALDAIFRCQWSPLLCAAGLMPWLGWTLAAKPTTGLATVGAFATRQWLLRSLAISAVLALVALLLDPHWCAEWISAVRTAHHFSSLVARPLGTVLLLALIRWRLPEARLLALLALAPQVGALYDALPLAMICSNRIEALTFALLSLATLPFLEPRIGSGAAFTAAAIHNGTVLLFALYLPALAAVLFLRSTRQGVPVMESAHA